MHIAPNLRGRPRLSLGQRNPFPVLMIMQVQRRFRCCFHLVYEHDEIGLQERRCANESHPATNVSGSRHRKLHALILSKRQHLSRRGQLISLVDHQGIMGGGRFVPAVMQAGPICVRSSIGSQYPASGV